ncbi:GNAT family N-acetyltransferase [Glutamicibacter uratoxydans]|uniref:GNAT family N-acetyltransferase n=1 Tax=Glutamicibacter uratoxydans TaxID=43667 RepID=UPI003D6F94B2
MSQIQPAALPDKQRYVLDDAGKHIGRAHYRDYQSSAGVERIFFHTAVDEEYGGQGLAGKLVTFALQDTIAAGIKIVAVCPYVKAFVRKHEEYEPHLVSTAPHHIDLLPKQ